ncbi:hypothetical protein VPH35_074729 [Triticum aestivum]
MQNYMATTTLQLLKMARRSACHSVGHSASVNALLGLAAPDKHRAAGRLTNSRDKALYEGLSKRTRFCSILSPPRSQEDGPHVQKEGMPQKSHGSQGNERTAE